MIAVVGRVWEWVRPTLSYRPWGSSSMVDQPADPGTNVGKSTTHGWGLGGVNAWLYGRFRGEPGSVSEEFWEAQEKLQPTETEVLGAGRPDCEKGYASRWWGKIRPLSFSFWNPKAGSGVARRRKGDLTGHHDNDGEFSDYETPPPSPTPPTSHLLFPFAAYASSWSGEILPEHYDICFNFLRHLFDLFTVGFLWTVSPPTKLVLEVLGVQGALRLWLHGMAMFLVSTAGMAGVLWLIQEYLPQFALIYGIVQAIVISVSVRQSLILGGVEEEEQEKEVKDDNQEVEKDGMGDGHKEQQGSSTKAMAGP